MHKLPYDNTGYEWQIVCENCNKFLHIDRYSEFLNCGRNCISMSVEMRSMILRFQVDQRVTKAHDAYIRIMIPFLYA